MRVKTSSGRVPCRPLALAALLCGLVSFAAGAQQQVGAGRDGAPVDLTGYWVSLITEDWRFRMVTPARGDYDWVPLNARGRQVADAWDPDRDAAREDPCQAYGAPAIMRMPVRLRISWRDDDTLQIETDAGQQIRLLHFTVPPDAPAEATWQGRSTAAWESEPRTAGRGGGAAPAAATGSLKVVTTSLRAGYLRTNGVPYSAEAVLTEWFDRHVDFGVEWLTHTQVVDDPVYLSEPYILNSHFRREPDGTKWQPRPCEHARPLPGR
jgi:hypothetical protein